MKTTTVLWLVLVALVAAAVAVFAASNAQSVQIHFMGWQPEPSLALLVIGAFLAGGVVVGAISLPGRIRLGLRVRTLERQLAAMPSPPQQPQLDAATADHAAPQDARSGSAARGADAAGQGARPAPGAPPALPAPTHAGPIAPANPADPRDRSSGATPPHPPARP